MRSKFKLGDAIIVRQPIDVTCCNTTINKGERGKVIDVDPETRDLTIRVCGDHPALACRRNIITLCANEVRQIKRAESRWRSRGRAFLFAAGAIALFFAPGDKLMDAFIQKAAAVHTPPVAYQTYQLLTDHVRLNERLEFHGERLMVRPCIFRWTHSFIRASDGRLVAVSQNDAHHVSPSGKADAYDFWLDVPQGLEPGDYILKNAATMDCDGGDIVNYFQPAARFTLEGPNS